MENHKAFQQKDDMIQITFRKIPGCCEGACSQKATAAFQGKNNGDLDYTVVEIPVILTGLSHTEKKTRIYSRTPSFPFYIRSLHWKEHKKEK